MKEKTRQMGNIRILDDRGFCYIPKLLRKELAIEGKGFDVPFFLNANCVLLVRKGATKEDVIKGLDVLKQDIELRTKEVSE